MQEIEAGIDRLYQGDLGSFIAARNALAKAAKRPDLKALEKPGLAAWAVNQLYWHHRPVVEAVVHAAEAVRDAHARALAGTPADIRAAETTHRAAIREAVRTAATVLVGAGHPATAATIEAITRTCEALPSPEANGRLVKPLAPAGLEALAGLTLAAAVPLPAQARPLLRVVHTTPSTAAAADDAGAACDRARARERAEALAGERRARREAAHAALGAAETALVQADAAVAAAEAALAEAQRAREAARARVRQARRDLDTL